MQFMGKSGQRQRHSFPNKNVHILHTCTSSAGAYTLYFIIILHWHFAKTRHTFTQARAKERRAGARARHAIFQFNKQPTNKTRFLSHIRYIYIYFRMHYRMRCCMKNFFFLFRFSPSYHSYRLVLGWWFFIFYFVACCWLWLLLCVINIHRWRYILVVSINRQTNFNPNNIYVRIVSIWLLLQMINCNLFVRQWFFSTGHLTMLSISNLMGNSDFIYFCVSPYCGPKRRMSVYSLRC